MDRTTATTVKLVVRGRVQGVGYRAWTRRNAVGLSLSGWVRNRRDGSVEAVLAGDAVAVRTMIDLMRRGPAGAAVVTVETGDMAPDPSLPAGFEVRPTA
jgi:acylphosphatase